MTNDEYLYFIEKLRISASMSQDLRSWERLFDLWDECFREQKKED